MSTPPSTPIYLYLIPRRDGRILIGNTLEHEGFVKATTTAARADLHRAAIGLFPSLRHAPVENHWAGLRPGSPKGIPYIGACPGIRGLYCNAGHYRNGLIIGPASARLAADLLLERDPTPRPITLCPRCRSLIPGAVGIITVPTANRTRLTVRSRKITRDFSEEMGLLCAPLLEGLKGCFVV